MENRMSELIHILEEASDAYYNSGEEIMSNREYDAYFDELVRLERETGVTLPNSPTNRVGAVILDSLPKVMHEFPALSLDKTKDLSLLRSAMEKGKSDDSVLMWKLDGSTIIATFDEGKLTRLATRGNGEVGSDITHNARFIKGLPKTIPFKGHLVVRGEAVMTYAEFERINASLSPEEQYKNPRNLANATITLLDSSEMKQRGIEFYAFALVTEIENGKDTKPNEFNHRMIELENLGFQTVEWEKVSNDKIEETVAAWSEAVSEHQVPFPVDGLVITNNDAAYAEAQPGTGHNPNRLAGFAFKWQDDLVLTNLRDIEWSVGRTGVITPVAIFDPVEIEGTTVSRASLHNLSELQRTIGTPYKGQVLQVYKANKIIPQIEQGELLENLPKQEQESAKQHIIAHPTDCPCCQTPTKIKTGNLGVQVLTCENGECPARQIGALAHFCERDCMNILGMSEETITKLVNAGIVKEYADFFHLNEHPEIMGMDGFGKKSWENMCVSAEKAKETDFVSFLHALGIPNIGKGQAKLLKKYLEDNYTQWRTQVCKDDPEFAVLHPEYSIAELYLEMASLYSGISWSKAIQGFGDVLEKNLNDWNEKHLRGTDMQIWNLIEELTFTDTPPVNKKEDAGITLEGKTFVITGDVYHYKNRNELQSFIESLGGKCAGSVSSKTSYLINNDIESTSGKNKKAKELGIPIISEEDFMEMIGEKEKENIDR